MRRHDLDTGWTLSRLEPGRAPTDPDLAADGPRPVPDGGPRELDLAAVPVARMPAQVADVLRAADLIDDVWLPGKAAEYGWIADSDWVYATRFRCDAPHGRLRLVCEGLDTVADVYLNGRLVGHHENSFLPFEADVTEEVDTAGDNRLQIHFHSITRWLGFVEPPADLHDMEPTRLLRKPFHDFTDYLGPKPYFARVGVFDAVGLVEDGEGRFADVSVGSSLSATLDAGHLEVACSGVVDGAAPVLVVRLTAPDGSVTEHRSPVRGPSFTEVLGVDVDAPDLWWPRGHGAQDLYEVEVDLVAGGVVQDSRRVLTAFRRLEMPEPLHFVVNGRPVRLWGACWAPLDVTTRCWDGDRARSLLDLAVTGHMNALRVWAEGAPVPEEFYEHADRLGLLLWQDFHQIPMSLDPAFRAAGRTEAAHTVRRLRHHPSIVIWCGGNENGMWHDFRRPGTPHPQRVVLEDDLREVCNRLDPERPYIPDSPYFGLDANDPRVWDTHGYTNVWFVPGYDHLNFATEDTRISAPPLHSCRRFMRHEELDLTGYSTAALPGTRYPWPASWTAYTASEGWRKVGPVEQLYDAATAEGVVHRLGAAAAAYYRDVVERQRRGRPSGLAPGGRRCGGYLAWKLNDSWPEIYSAKVDYFGEPYQSFYALRRAFAPLLVSIDVGEFIHVWAVNDTAAPVDGVLAVQLVDLTGATVRNTAEYPVALAPDQSVDVADLTTLLGTFRRDHVLVAELRDADGAVLASTTALMDLERNLDLPDPHLTLWVEDGSLLVGSDTFARAVHLTGDDDGDAFGWLFEDNYFDLAPGELKRVPVHGDHRSGSVSARPFYSTHGATVAYEAAR